MKAFDTVRLALALVLFISPETSSLSCTAGQGYLSDETLNKRLGGTPIDLNTYTTVVDMPQCRVLCGGHVGNCKSFIYNSQSQVCIIYAVDKTDYPLVDDAGFSYYDNLRCGFVTTTTTSATPSPEPEPSQEPAAEISSDAVFDWIRGNTAYVAMIGMGVMIVLLTITAIVILCCYSGRDRDRSGGYVKN